MPLFLTDPAEAGGYSRSASDIAFGYTDDIGTYIKVGVFTNMPSR